MEDDQRKVTELAKQQRNFCVTWINKIASAANVEISKSTIAVYLERLITLPREQLDFAGRRTIDDWKEASKMPPLPFILARTGTDPKLLAEQAWEQVQAVLSEYWHPDQGWLRYLSESHTVKISTNQGPPDALTPAMLYAIRQCGGEARISATTLDDFPFIRRQFLESHTRFQMENGAQLALTEGQAKAFLKQLSSETGGSDPV